MTATGEEKITNYLMANWCQIMTKN
jgi:hypothetical protein